MKIIKDLFYKYKEIITYLIFGGLTTVVGLGSFYLFDWWLGEKLYLVTNTISWIFAVTFAFVTNKLWVFESKNGDKKVVFKEAISFYSARLVTLGTEEAGLWVLVTGLGVGELSLNIAGFKISGNLIAKAIIAVVVVILNYILSKLIVFKRKEEK